MTRSTGDSVDLQCNASGSPLPYITWARVGGSSALIPGWGMGYEGNMLSLQSLTPDARGVYVCSALNLVGSDRWSLELIILCVYSSLRFGLVIELLCVVFNARQPNTVFFIPYFLVIHCLVDPIVKVQASQLSQAVGYNKQLLCTISGNPVPTASQVKWQKDGATVTNSRR